MDIDLVMGFRNLFLCGVVVTSASLAPQTAARLVRRIRSLCSVVPAWFRYLHGLIRDKSRSQFWEIDMTKFEP